MRKQLLPLTPKYNVSTINLSLLNGISNEAEIYFGERDKSISEKVGVHITEAEHFAGRASKLGKIYSVPPY
ncbi:hypothetical protein D8M05_15635 [Oceanobacillus bengalensis]|uniref:Uncharacterized protein n=2 Tax=Oceanobacillus bengalensis TaxID=1435466 RepID=A0A494YU55_9BACI|nr:hypothetical protein [Oceanobacillus bengalensis]RKQ13661.1 hypothetical protein D8M05_15635 [Oceanobacillus bengalensis]